MSQPWDYFPKLRFIDQNNKPFNPQNYFECFGDKEIGGWKISFVNTPYKIVYNGKKYDEVTYRITDIYYNNIDQLTFYTQDTKYSLISEFYDKNPEKTKDFNNRVWNVYVLNKYLT